MIKEDVPIPLKGKLLQNSYEVRFNEEIQEPIMAYTFKNIQGTEITGTNTMYENAKDRTHPEKGIYVL